MLDKCLEVDFLVTRRVYTLAECEGCGGSGRIKELFRRKSFNHSCVMCGGSGVLRVANDEQVPLCEAIAELKKRNDEKRNNNI